MTEQQPHVGRANVHDFRVIRYVAETVVEWPREDGWWSQYPISCDHEHTDYDAAKVCAEALRRKAARLIKKGIRPVRNDAGDWKLPSGNAPKED